MRDKLGIAAFVAGLTLFSAGASAHPLLDDAVASYEDADFKAALRTFNLAARDADLSLEELLQLFEMRALVHHAMGNDTAMRRDLERVAVLRPNYRLGDLAPPPVRRAFHELLEANEGSLGGGVVVEEKDFDAKRFVISRVEGVPRGLVHRVGLQCEMDSDGRMVSRTVQGLRVRIALPESGYYQRCDATAQTRRGTVLFSASIEGKRPAPVPEPAPEVPSAEPVSLEPLPVPASPEAPSSAFAMPKYEGTVDEPEAKKKKKWPWIVAASALVVAGGVTAGVLISKKSSDSQPAPGGLRIEW